MKASNAVVRAELTCLHCGYDVGEVEGRRNAHPEELIFLAMHQGDRLVLDSRGRFRCPRCGGQVLVNGVRPVSHPLDPATFYEAEIDREHDKSA
jgi:DNA-directed RNA polymerase subunit RPC12/RpoP